MSEEFRRVRREIGIDDLPDYVAAFKTSSDRARFAFYIVIVATVLIAITNYNVQDYNWPRQRIANWFNEPVPPEKAPPHAGGIAPDRARREAIRDEYLRQFASRAMFTESPIPGVSIDANDLGILGGTALTLIMLVFLLCVIREHENLYLALYKLRMVCEREGDACGKGESEANLLYHSLAMSQVFSAPPTLARWQRKGILTHFGVLFFAPPAVYAWVFWADLATRVYGEAYGVDVGRQLLFEAILMLIIVAISASAWLHTNAMSKRWRRAFFRVNDRRRLVDQMSQWDWLKIGPDREEDARVPARLATLLVDTVTEESETQHEEVPIVPLVVRDIAKSHITREQLRDATREICARGDAAARAKCATHDIGHFKHLVRFDAATNVVSGNKWTIAGTWTFLTSRRP